MLLKPTVLVVDDTPDNLSLMSALLRDEYRVKVANHGDKALRIVQEDPPDLILLDVMMPDLDGYEVCRRLKAMPQARELPVIFLTAKSEVADETLGFSLGAVDYITKPISPPIVLARVRTHLLLKQSQDFLRDKAEYLEAEVARRGAELAAIQDVTILAMASLAETRDNDTGNHIRRTQHYVRALALQLRNDPRYAPQLGDAAIELLYKSAPLHDIGKVGIPDHILLKPGKLTPEEWEIMKTHAEIGAQAIAQAEADSTRPVEFLRIAQEIARCHHEKWDGSGYPGGLAGEQIPVSARLMALADVFDALICARVYKPAMPMDEAYRIIVAGSGSHFDPDVVDAFIREFETFKRIAHAYAE